MGARGVGIAIAATLLVGAGSAFLGASGLPDLAPPAPEGPRGEPVDPPAPEGVLAVEPGATDGEVAVVRAGGRVDFVAVADGKAVRRFRTEARPWSVRFPHGDPGACPSLDHIPETRLSGIPLSGAGGNIVAVGGDSLWRSHRLGGEPAGARASPEVRHVTRQMIQAPWLRDARLVASGRPRGPVFVALADGRVARVDGRGEAAFSTPFPGRILRMALAGPDGPLLVGGTAPVVLVLSCPDLGVLSRWTLRGDPPPVTAVGVSSDGRRAVVAHGLCLPDVDFLRVGRLGANWDGEARSRLLGKGPGATAVALHPLMEDRIAYGKSAGGVGYCERGRGYHGFPGGGPGGRFPVPLQGLAFASGGMVLVAGWDDGTLRGSTYPEEDGIWGGYPDFEAAAR